MSEQTRVIRCALIGMGFLAFGAGGAQGQWHYYYFKEKRPLKLDVDRVALLRPAAPLQLAAPSRAAGSSPREGPDRLQVGSAHPTLAAQLGIDPDTVQPWPIKGWFLAGTAAAMKTPVAVQQIVRRISNQKAAEFVSPVFVDNDGGALIVTPEILVGFKRDIDPARAEAILAELKIGTILDRNWANMKMAYRVRSALRNGFDVLKAANRLAERPEVKFAEPDMIFTGHSSLIPNDPGFSNCWGLHNKQQFGGILDMDMDAPEAWDITTGDPSIKVVIIDTGVQQDHPDINQIPGTDTTGQGGGGGPVNACDNHGTAVAGCVSATINNALGTVGVAPDCVSASARTFISTLDCSGSWNAQFSWTVDTLAWAESIGARVTNNSNIYSYGNPSAAITQKYEDTRNNGMVHFASAHNDGIAQISFPANLPTVNAVAALDPDGTLTSFSNWGEGLAFSAPGIDIYTTDRTGAAGWVPGDYVFAWGTSFASPYTAGVAALALSLNPVLSAIEVEEIMQQSSVDLGSPGYDIFFGWGFVNAHETLLLAAPPTVEPCELDKLTADEDGAADDWFGWSVAVSRDTAVIGARFGDGLVTDSGAAYVFEKVAGTWTQTTKLTASDGAVGDSFGSSVSISGDVAVIGARAGDGMATNSGSAYVFEKVAGLWTQTAELTASDGAAGDLFGHSVSISGEWVVIGAVHDVHAAMQSGSAYFFKKPPVGWSNTTETAKRTASDAAESDHFGESVSISGNVAVVGAHNDDDRGADSGSAYVFEKVAGVWTQTAKLTAGDGAALHNFGNSVAVDGDTAVIGAVLHDGLGTDSGAAYVFEKTAGVWMQTAKVTAADGTGNDRFGQSVSISGNLAVVGSPNDDDECPGDPNCDSGSAYMFRFDGSTWIDAGKVTASDAAANDQFGNSVSISGNTAVTGAYLDDDSGTDSGSAYVFGVAGDCNRNGIDDVCDIRDETSQDNNGDGVPDDCQCIRPSAPEAETLPATSLQSPLAGGTGADAVVSEINVKNRYVSIKAGEAGRNLAIRVRFVDLPSPFDVWNFANTGLDFFVGAPFRVCENSGQQPGLCPPGGGTCSNPPNNACDDDRDCCGAAGPLPRNWFWAAPLVCDKGSAHVMDWHGVCDDGDNDPETPRTCDGGLNDGVPCATDDDCFDVVHLYHEGLVPRGVYDVQVVDAKLVQAERCYSPPLRMTQGVWGDICSDGPGGACTGAADGNPEVIQDVLGCIDKFQNINALQKARADLVPAEVDFKVTIIGDCLFGLDAFMGFAYPFTPGDPCGPG